MLSWCCVQCKLNRPDARIRLVQVRAPALSIDQETRARAVHHFISDVIVFPSLTYNACVICAFLSLSFFIAYPPPQAAMLRAARPALRLLQSRAPNHLLQHGRTVARGGVVATFQVCMQRHCAREWHSMLT